MDNMQFEKSLVVLNYLLGLSIFSLSLYLYYSKKNVVPLYITLAVIIAGPLEDLLVLLVESSKGLSPDKKKKLVCLVDQLTSLGFLIFLLLAVIESSV